MVPPWAMKYLPLNLIGQTAEKWSLDPYLVAAIVWKESRGDQYACRYEPNWKWFNDVQTHAKNNKISRETETRFQMTSWGLMQVMGATCRDLGFLKQLPKLSLPNVGLEYGCKYLSKQLKRYENKTTDAVSAYNMGTVSLDDNGDYVNKNYVRDVMQYYQELTK